VVPGELSEACLALLCNREGVGLFQPCQLEAGVAPSWRRRGERDLEADGLVGDGSRRTSAFGAPASLPASVSKPLPGATEVIQEGTLPWVRFLPLLALSVPGQIATTSPCVGSHTGRTWFVCVCLSLHPLRFTLTGEYLGLENLKTLLKGAFCGYMTSRFHSSADLLLRELRVVPLSLLSFSELSCSLRSPGQAGPSS